MPTMFDAISASDLPAAGANAYAGYVGGHWPDYASIVARFPDVPVLSIAINASEAAMCLDIENGDATNSQAAAWVKAAQKSMPIPYVYTSVSNAQALLKTLAAAGIPRSAVRLWTAHYTFKAHLCSPTCGFGLTTTADGTQWTDTAGSCDESLISTSFFATSTPPFVSNVTSYPGDNMQAITANVQIQNGHGWIPSPVPAASVINAPSLDENPGAVGRYDQVPTFQGLATTAAPGAPNGALVFTGPVDGTFGVVIWAAS